MMTADTSLMYDLAAAVENITARLNVHRNTEWSGLPELALRAFKAAEEAGELAEAVIGATGQNPRKGVTHTWDDAVAEALDVVLTALVFAESAQPGEVRRVLMLVNSRMRGGPGLVAVACRVVARLDAEANRHVPALAELVSRGLRVQKAAGELAEAVIEALAVFDPEQAGDPASSAVDLADCSEWGDAVSAAITLAKDALVFAETVYPGETAGRLAVHMAAVKARATRFAMPAVA